MKRWVSNNCMSIACADPLVRLSPGMYCADSLCARSARFANELLGDCTMRTIAVCAGGCRAALALPIWNRPVSIEVARRSRHSRLASRKISSRSTAVSASKPAVMVSSNS